MEEEKKLNKNFSKWKKLKNVLKGVILLRQLEVQHINNGVDIIIKKIIFYKLIFIKTKIQQKQLE